MKQIFILAVFITAFSGFSVLSAQTDTNTYHIRDYGVKLNRSYFIVTMEGEIKECVFLAVNTYDVLIREDGESETEVMQKSDIKTITTEYPKTSSLVTYKPIQFISTRWCIGGGIILNKFSQPFKKGYEIGSNSYDNTGNYTFGYQLSVNYTGIISTNIAIRTDLEFVHENSGVEEYFGDERYATDYYTRVSGGALDQICLKLMFGFGHFLPEEDVTINFFLGLGAGIRFTGGMTFYSNSSYFNELTETKDPYSTFTALASTSLLIGYRPFKKAGIFLEPQINLWVIKRMPVQFSLRTGIMF